MLQNSAFDAFYQSPLGLTARRLIRRRLRPLLVSASRQNMLAYGFAQPYRSILSGTAFLAEGPAGRDRSVMLPPLAEGKMDAADGSFDRVVLIHALEYASAPNLLLAESRRVLANHGRIIVVVPNRHGLWAQAESTPFGHGTPYSALQLRRLLHEENFTLEDMRRALFAPPLDAMTAHYCASGVEAALCHVVPGAAGVLIGVARKNIYAPTGLLVARRPVANFVPALNASAV